MIHDQDADERNSKHYLDMLRIRRFEEKVLEMFPRGVFFGTTHTYLGQEANAVGVLSKIGQDDIVFSNHRGHGHFLAYGGDMRALFAELMGKSTGVCAGKGGSQHLHWKNFYSNGIQGGIAPVAAGMAMSEKLKRSAAVTIAFLGDGTLGEGVVYEALNITSLWQLPIFFVLENNRIAQTTPIELAVSGDILARFSAFNIPCRELETSDVMAIEMAAKELLNEIRTHSAPRALVLHSYRFGPHSKGDDTRPAEEIERLYRDHDPIKFQAVRLDSSQLKAINGRVEREVSEAYEAAFYDPFPGSNSKDVDRDPHSKRK
jgi:TPP-dependent pyruvate/acetoin dehydrogenase alpha subunit